MQYLAARASSGIFVMRRARRDVGSQGHGESFGLPLPAALPQYNVVSDSSDDRLIRAKNWHCPYVEDVQTSHAILCLAGIPLMAAPAAVVSVIWERCFAANPTQKPEPTPAVLKNPSCAPYKYSASHVVSMCCKIENDLSKTQSRVQSPSGPPFQFPVLNFAILSSLLAVRLLL